MPTLDDVPTLQPLTTVTSDDLLAITDLTGAGSTKVRKVTTATLAQGVLGTLPTVAAGSATSGTFYIDSTSKIVTYKV